MSAEEEGGRNGAGTAEEQPLPGGDFRLFVQKLGYQALISLGVLENPITKTRAANLGLARGVIDDLVMLRDKTNGNLEETEDEHLRTVIKNLQDHFARISESGG